MLTRAVVEISGCLTLNPKFELAPSEAAFHLYHFTYSIFSGCDMRPLNGPT